MASVSTDKNGNRRVLFAGTDGKRKTIYLGKTNKAGLKPWPKLW